MRIEINAVTAAIEHGVDVSGRRIFLHGDVDEDTIGRAIRGIYLLSGISDQPITLFVSSYGGSLDDAFALHDVTRTVVCPIHTVALGKCQSAAPLLVACGQKGERWSGALTSFMLHDLQISPPEGSPVLVDSWVEDGNRARKQYVELLAQYTRKRASHWERFFRSKSDRFFTADQAQEWGLIDHIWDEKV
jgi:ATP-dependent Clp protease protease subunit